MARESNAPLEPLTPGGKPNSQPHPAHIQEPEFGKPSPIGPPQHRSNHLFNIPKPNQSRAEHHRPAPRPQPQHQPQSRHQGQSSATPHAYRPQGTSGGPFATPSVKRSEPWDPFKPVAPSAYNNPRGGFQHGAVSIKRPENVTWSTPRAPRPIYQSKPLPPMAGASKNIQKFIDLTRDDTDPVPRASAYATQGFGAMDMNGYVDTAMAQENIKALLEGAFEDEEDKPKPKRKGKKKKGGKKKSKNTSEKEKDEVVVDKKKEEAIDDLDDLAAQLQGVTVNDPKEDSAKSENDSSAKVGQDEGDDEAAEEEEEEDEEDSDEEEDGVVEGLKVTLLPHQIDGVRWMCDKETGRKTSKGIFPKGGILADDMGLGKTVQAIALLLKNRKSDHEHDSDAESEGKTTKLPPNCISSTLVIAPLALIKQWEAEIKDKVEPSHKLRVCVYHGANRTKTSTTLDKYDVVITTYGTLTSEFNSSASDKAKKAGIFAVHWYRIILDEAHTIKNRNAKATQSAYALDAQYRWCLTGTPLQNNLDELQSLIKFLRVKPYDDLAAWRDQISRPLNNGRGGLAIQRLQVYLKAFMKRRTKDVLRQNDNVKPGEEGPDGKPKKSANGFHIAKREVIKVDAEFMPGELNFYKRLEQRTENSLEKMMGSDKVDYAGALVLLLRLRQACNHPDLVKGDLAKDKDILLQNGSASSQQTQSKPDDLDSIADLFGAMSVIAKKCDVCQTDLSPNEIKAGGSRCGECEADLNTNVIGTDKKKKKSKKSHKKLDVLDSPTARKSDAQLSRSRKNRPIIIDSDDEEEEEGDWVVPEHQRNIPSLGKAGGSDDENAEGGGEWLVSDDDDESDDEIESPSRRKSKPIVLSDSEDESDSETEDIYNDEGANGELPSTKIRHLMRILNREAPDFKFIVFSVFTSMLDKVEPFLKSANIGFARYDGGMANNHREASLEKLRNNSGTRVLLCSLRAGALGLNLTAASRVVILEPFWNPFVEEQAIDRVHRLNQTVDVKIYKMVIKGSVEERIVALQDRKRELANATIEGKTGAGKLTMRDMMALFGRDAESKFTDNQTTLDFNQPTRLLNTGDETEPAQSSRESSQSAPRSQGSQGQPNRERHEHSVYGRRW
ncbi:SNF2-related protein [Penicillium griseofulvum]|uniref:SNF2-related protein n=1 Tax=Penicillium patulum TaxID=5078 RepID=A0A135LGI0_PENPA|nr:SNF2-related protein [Penicillium griseofulvum]KXG48069.1 SNF2-related protein [Penicillium griseofulvum]